MVSSSSSRLKQAQRRKRPVGLPRDVLQAYRLASPALHWRVGYSHLHKSDAAVLGSVQAIGASFEQSVHLTRLSWRRGRASRGSSASWAELNVLKRVARTANGVEENRARCGKSESAEAKGNGRRARGNQGADASRVESQPRATGAGHAQLHLLSRPSRSRKAKAEGHPSKRVGHFAEGRPPPAESESWSPAGSLPVGAKQAADLQPPVVLKILQHHSG